MNEQNLLMKQNDSWSVKKKIFFVILLLPLLLGLSLTVNADFSQQKYKGVYTLLHRLRTSLVTLDMSHIVICVVSFFLLYKEFCNKKKSVNNCSCFRWNIFTFYHFGNEF